MGPIGFQELALIVIILIIIFGATRLPEIGRGLGKAISNFKSAVKEEKDKDEAQKTLGSSAKEKEK